jgi:xanthosine utilization system XapX-like protein
MHGTLIVNAVSACVVCLMGLVGFTAGVGVVDTAQHILGPPPERSMQLSELSIDRVSGTVTQRLTVNGGPISANWSAEILRGDESLCSGGGVAPYNGEVATFSIDGWVGDDCPVLNTGDQARGVWEYRTKEGFVVSIKGEVTVD